MKKYSRACFVKFSILSILFLLSFCVFPLTERAQAASISVDSISLSKNDLTIPMGTKNTITATILPSNAGNKAVQWSTSNSAIATVTNGAINAVGVGTTTITAITSDGNHTATCTVKVIKGVSSIVITSPSKYVNLGDDITLTATVNPADASDNSLTWKSSNTNVATVDSNGKVHAVTYGTASISATSVQDPTKIGSYTIVVPVPVAGVTINSKSDLVNMGNTLTLYSVLSPTNATNKTVTWTSSDEGIATVNESGIVTPISSGSVSITVTTADGSFTATKDLKVIYGVSKVILNKISTYIKVGDDETLTAAIDPANATDDSLTWKSSNTNVATVDSSGKVHAVAYGTAVISAISVQDPTKIGNCNVIVSVPVTNVAINSKSDVVKMGTTLTLDTTISPTNATIKTITWSSSDESIAKVSSTGIVTPVSPGTVTITATTTDGSLTATKELKIIYGINSISLNKASTTITQNSDETLTVTINPSNATDTSVTWVSSNPSVATVDSNGKVHAVAFGTAVISATSVQDTAKIAKCTVTVPIKVTGISINNSPDFVQSGGTLALTTTISPSNATDKTVTWTSSNESIARVSATGVVIPVAPGTVTITATTTDGSLTATKDLTIIYGVSSITLNKTSVTIPKGSDETLIATVNPSNADNKTLVWKSSNTNVATVDSNGVVHAVASGTATISAISEQDSTRMAKCTVNIPTPVESVSISSNSDIVKIGSTLTLSASISPTTATIKTVSWTSSDVNIATINANGVVIPVAPGTVTITATSTDGNLTATKELKVVNAVTSIELNKASTTISKDSDETLTTTFNPSNATDKSLTWRSSNNSIATVDSAGNVHAVAFGSAIISAASVQDPTKTAKCTVIVPIHITDITINSSVDFVKMGNTLNLYTAILPTNATIKTVTWTSSNEGIAKVSSTGVVTPVAPGTVTITAKTTDGNLTATKELTVVYGVTAVTLNKTTTAITKGSDETLTAIVYPGNATNNSLTWKSNNIGVATVDSNGKVHAVAIGTAVISATSVQDSTKIAKCTVTVPVHVIGISIKSSSNFVKMGSSLALSTTLSPSNATIKTVTWTSSDVGIAKVSSTGVVTPVAPGTVTITAKTTDGNLTATKAFTVVNGVSSITLNKSAATITKGSDEDLTATVNPSNATNNSLTWKSSNTAVATVDSNGKIHAIAYGTATISATSVQDSTKSANCVVTVPAPVTGISISSSYNVVKMGSTLTLTAVIKPTSATTKNVTWTSSDESIAYVSSNGVVVPVSPGTVTITAKTTDGNFTATKELPVVYAITSLSLNKTSTTIAKGSTETLTAIFNPSNATDKSLVWKSSNTAIATVDSNGVVHGIAPGTTVISATSVQDSNRIAKCSATITT